MKHLKFIMSIIITCCISFSIIPVVGIENNLDPDNDGIPGIRGIDYDIMIISKDITLPKYENDYSQPSLYAAPGYSVRNVKKWSDGSKPFALSQRGTPGGTIKFSTTATISLSADTSLGIGYNDVSAKVGFSVSTSYSQTLVYSYAIPSTYNGRAVATCEVKPWLDYTRYKYDFYFLEVKTGSGYSDKPIRVDYVHVYTYK